MEVLNIEMLLLLIINIQYLSWPLRIKNKTNANINQYRNPINCEVIIFNI